MVSKPYDDDDDAPTLQRGVSVSGPAARLGSVSGLRPAALLPLEDLAGGGFEEDEATTAVDRAPLDGADAAANDDTDVALESPADLEPTTANLPVDVAAVLRHASTLSEPPPSPLGGPLTDVMIPPRAPSPSSHDG